MPLTPTDLLMVVVLPATVALLILFIARRVWRSERDINGRFGCWAGPAAVAAAILVAFPWRSVMAGVNVFPPRESLGWIFHAALVVALAGIIDAIFRLRWFVRATLAFVLGAATSAAMLKFKWSGASPDWSPGNAIAILCGIGAISAAWFVILDWVERDRTTFAAAPWTFWIISAGAAATCGMFGGLKQAQLIGSLAAASGAALGLTLVRRRPILVRGTAIAFAVFIVPLVAAMFYLLDLKPGEPALLVCVLFAPAVAAAGRAVPVGGRAPFLRNVIRIAPLVIFMTVVLVLAGIQFKKAMQEDADADEYSLAATSYSTSLISRAI